MSKMGAMLEAFTDAIEAGTVDVETARAAILAAHRKAQQENRQRVATCSTTEQVIKALGVNTVEEAVGAMGISKATLYRKMGAKQAIAATGGA